jgi:hypothetical protein
MLLFRTHQFDLNTRAYCLELSREAGLEVVCLADESHGPLDVGDLPKISVSESALAALGLHRPKEVQWRCGDYGLYLAAQAYPEVEYFWLLEYDVRIRSLDRLANFFSGFANDETDLIAPLLGVRGADWWWRPAMASRGRPVYGCLFPLVRASARLAEAGLAERLRIGHSPIYRLFWPNDESFLATHAMRSGLSCRDLNAGGRDLYTAQTFSFHAPISGEVLEAMPPDGMIHHPVLYGQDYDRKRSAIGKTTALRHRLQRRLRSALAVLA